MIETKASKTDVWNAIHTTLIANDIVPLEIRLHPADIVVRVELAHDAIEEVGQALKLFGLPEGEAWVHDGGVYLWSEGTADEFYVWGRYNWYSGGASPLLPGWGVEVYCHVLTANFPLVDAPTDVLPQVQDRDGYLYEVLPDGWLSGLGAKNRGTFERADLEKHYGPLREVAAPAEVLTGEVTSPFGPCSGLTPDLRDNPCTNFAAEYVSYPSPTAGLTVGEEFTPATEYRRLCTPCADAAPGRISRRPLTTAPGGYPVERAEVTAQPTAEAVQP